MSTRITEAKEVLVGAQYWVPGIEASLWAGAQSRWWPVLGQPHHDGDYIKARGRHFHFDVRFLPDDLFPLSVNGGQAKVVTPQDMMVKIKVCGVTPHPIIWQEAACYRQMPDFPSWLAPWACDLAAGYKDATVLEGNLCPHQRFCLNGLPQDAAGNVTCPGHGLRWNLQTGRAA